MPPIKNKFNKGDKIKRFTVICECDRIKAGTRWIRAVKLMCECGNIVVKSTNDVLFGRTQSCGCYRKEMKIRLDHGKSKTSLYAVWKTMRHRCSNKNTECYDRYGGRGIKVCEEWDGSFEKFYTWSIANGWELGLQIDRFPDNDGNYEPSNCRWATRIENSNNKSDTIYVFYNGEKYPLKLICRSLNVNYPRIYSIIKRRKCTFEEAIIIPQKFYRKRYAEKTKGI